MLVVVIRVVWLSVGEQHWLFSKIPSQWRTIETFGLAHDFWLEAEDKSTFKIENVRSHPSPPALPWLQEMELVSLLAVPIRSESGKAGGTFCVADSQTRNWSAEECQLLNEFSATISATHVDRDVLRSHSAQDRAELVAALSHDIRNPLAAARLAAQMVLRKLGPNDPNVNHYCQIIVDNIDAVEKLIQRFSEANSHPPMLH